MRMSFFTDYDDVFSHYVNFVIDNIQILGDLLQVKVVKLCRVEFPDIDTVSKYIQDACVGGLCNSLPNLAKGLFLLQVNNHFLPNSVFGGLPAGSILISDKIYFVICYVILKLFEN